MSIIEPSAELLRQQLDTAMATAMAIGCGFTFTLHSSSTAAPVSKPKVDTLGLHPECFRLLTLLATAKDGILSLDAYASATERDLEAARGAIRGAHRAEGFIKAMDVLYTRFDDDRLGGGKMRCYRITAKGRALLTQSSTTH